MNKEKDVNVPGDDHLDGEQPLEKGPGSDKLILLVGVAVFVLTVSVIAVLTYITFVK